MIKIENKYPNIKVTNKNIEYANILSYDYAGIISEDTAVHQYIYQHIILKELYPELSKELLNIAITEMRHFSMLGEIITLLGKKPVISFENTLSNNDVPWNSNYINYSTSINDILKYNIQLESLAIKKYKKDIEFINDKYIKDVLKAIIKDEITHLNIFTKYYKRYSK